MSADKIIVDGCELQQQPEFPHIYRGERDALEFKVRTYDGGHRWQGVAYLNREDDPPIFLRLTTSEQGVWADSAQACASKLTELVACVREALATRAVRAERGADVRADRLRLRGCGWRASERAWHPSGYGPVREGEVDVSEKRKAVAICNAKRPCKGLALFVAKHGAYTAGIQAVHLTDTTTWKTITPPMYVIKCRATDKGVVMNHCPFCGESINERWTKPTSPAKGDGAESVGSGTRRMDDLRNHCDTLTARVAGLEGELKALRESNLRLAGEVGTECGNLKNALDELTDARALLADARETIGWIMSSREGAALFGIDVDRALKAEAEIAAGNTVSWEELRLELTAKARAIAQPRAERETKDV